MSDEHLPFEQLADYADGRLPVETLARVEAHLAGCAACQQEAAWLRATLSRDEWAAPPLRASAGVRRAFREQARPAPTFLDQLGNLLRPRPGWAVAVAALILLVAGAFFIRSWRTTEVAQIARLTSLSGGVEVLPAGAGTWRAAFPGNELRSGDRVRTQPGATATLTYFEGSEVRLDGETELSLMRLSARPDGQNQTIIVGQTSGLTTHLVRPLPNDTARYEVDTPGAVITVRGTVFTVRVGARGALEVRVSEGAVAVSGPGEPILVNAGAAFSVIPSSVITTTPSASPTPTPTAAPAVTATQPTPTTGTPATVAPPAVPTSAPPDPTPTPDADDDDDDG
jgi:hypothetical protein